MTFVDDWVAIIPEVEGTEAGEKEPYGEVVLSAGGPTGTTVTLSTKGTLLVNGRVVSTDAEIVAGLREFLTKALAKVPLESRARDYYRALCANGHFGENAPKEEEFVKALIQFVF